MRVKPGDSARVIKSSDGLMVGRIVEVLYGGVGHEADFADDWLERIDPDAANDSQFEVLTEKA